ncbi:hypothetical protein KKG52_00010 [Patescibacteria group bacterium]|nr:hypothetical protein [Patescibacteria group bacterium]
MAITIETQTRTPYQTNEQAIKVQVSKISETVKDRINKHRGYRNFQGEFIEGLQQFSVLEILFILEQEGRKIYVSSDKSIAMRLEKAIDSLKGTIYMDTGSWDFKNSMGILDLTMHLKTSDLKRKYAKGEITPKALGAQLEPIFGTRRRIKSTKVYSGN